MSTPPPMQPPPEGHAQYYRGGPPPYGTADKLEALAKSYYAISWVFVANLFAFWGIVFGMGAIAALILGPDVSTPKGSTVMGVMIIATYGIILLGFSIGPYPLYKRVGFGMGWSKNGPIVCSVLMGINSILCGIIGYVVLQQLVFAEMKKYGVRGGFFGTRKKDII